MELDDLLARLDPLQQAAVAMVYFEGRAPCEVARSLAVEHTVVGAALAAAYRRVAGWVMDEGEAGAVRPVVVALAYSRADAPPASSSPTPRSGLG